MIKEQLKTELKKNMKTQEAKLSHQIYWLLVAPVFQS